MSAIVLLDWSFSPPGFFEEPIEIARDDYTMTIAEGRVEARISSEIYDARPSLRQEIHDALNDRFSAAQLVSHKPYELSRSSMTRIHPDGRREISVECADGVLIVGEEPDLQVTDKHGNVLSDTRHERIEKKKTLAERIRACRKKSDLLEALLNSYNAAVNDPNNELVHLYEIRDALAKKFRDEKHAWRTLGIEAPIASRFETLCNNGSVRQGRHRGSSLGALRDATPAELAEARDIARGLIEAYLTWLEASGSALQ